MEKIKCFECGNPVRQTPGRRKKLYCGSTCRSLHWKKKQILGKPKRGPGRPPKKKKVLVVTVTEIDNAIFERKGLRVVAQEPVELVDKKVIQNQIADIRAEKIPAHRDTSNGRKSWAFDQKKRIQELEAKLK